MNSIQSDIRERERERERENNKVCLLERRSQVLYPCWEIALQLCFTYVIIYLYFIGANEAITLGSERVTRLAWQPDVCFSNEKCILPCTLRDRTTAAAICIVHRRSQSRIGATPKPFRVVVFHFIHQKEKEKKNT